MKPQTAKFLGSVRITDTLVLLQVTSCFQSSHPSLQPPNVKDHSLFPGKHKVDLNVEWDFNPVHADGPQSTEI